MRRVYYTISESNYYGQEFFNPGHLGGEQND